jgi:hypothetical protein
MAITPSDARSPETLTGVGGSDRRQFHRVARLDQVSIGVQLAVGDTGIVVSETGLWELSRRASVSILVALPEGFAQFAFQHLAWAR